MKVLFGTGNPAKFAAMSRRLEGIGVELIGLKDMKENLPEVVEDGRTPLENARKKATEYYKALNIPVFSCDSGLYFEGVPEQEQPGIHVRTVGGKYLTDDEMIAHYSALAEKYGGLKARYQNAICLVIDNELIYEAMEEDMASEWFLLTSKPHTIRKKGFPLDSLSVDLKTGKYYYDIEEEKINKVAVEDGFLKFFQRRQNSLR